MGPWSEGGSGGQLLRSIKGSGEMRCKYIRRILVAWLCHVILYQDPIQLEACDSNVSPNQLGRVGRSESHALALIRVWECPGSLIDGAVFNTSRIDRPFIGEAVFYYFFEETAFEVGRSARDIRRCRIRISYRTA